MSRMVVLVALLAGCELSAVVDLHSEGPEHFSGDVALEWSRLTVERVKADAMPPTHASRLYAYTGLALYGAIAAGVDEDAVLVGLSGLSLPEPPDEDVDWPTAVAVATAQVAIALAKSADSKLLFAELMDRQIADRRASGADEEDVATAIAHGEAVGAAIVAWAAADGFVDTRDLPFVFPEMDGLWQPTPPAFASSHEPWWGTLRPFLVTPADCVPADPAPYADEPGSPMWEEAEAVYEISGALDAEQTATALFWADDPGKTGTPPGHWVSIAAGVLDDDDADLLTAARAHAVLGMTLGDAFIGCWHTKYEECRMRPVTYIQAHIDPEWSSLIPTPPFPEYTSGHSVASGAAAEVLTAMLGDRAFVDVTRPDLGERAFDSFRAAADEAAISRLFAGIHYPMGIEAGLEQGVCVGQRAVQRTTGP